MKSPSPSPRAVLPSLSVLLLLACGGSLPADDPAAAARATAAAVSPCQVSAASVVCAHATRMVSMPGYPSRAVLYQVPAGTPPAAGWPVVLFFQGSFVNPALCFVGVFGEPLGGYYQAAAVAELLGTGYAVLAPNTHLSGETFWDTNVPPWSVDWSAAPDNAFMLAIFAAIDAGDFGPLDGGRLYATGISSGGYMTSRMAVSYQGRFKALAIHSGSYATCAGPLCVIPATLPADHPPTLFLHGLLDPIVPIATMLPYRDLLNAEGHPTRMVINNLAVHEFIPEAPDAITGWFQSWP